jgi:ring-1,2-phenylacetyl-CoA epoxidase subunit PaaC
MAVKTQNFELLTLNLRAALGELLLALADDEFVIGYANSEWTGIAPLLEEDIAFSSLAQDELGHAKLYYEMLAELGVRGWELEMACAPTPGPHPLTPDSLAYGRALEGFRNAAICELPRGDWAYSVSRQFLYDTADYARLESLQQSAYVPLAAAAGSIIREEKYHLLHAHTWLERMAGGSAEARKRQRAAFTALWPDALGLFEPLPGEAALVAAGIMPAPSTALQARWLASIAEPLQRLGLPWPFEICDGVWSPSITPAYGGRCGAHGVSFLKLHNAITSVYRLDPSANW